MDAGDENRKIQPVYLPWQKPLIENILSLKQQKRLPHAALVDLSSDEGGIEFVWHLVMLILCHDVVDASPCGQCESCRLMLANTYPDFFYVGLMYSDKRKKMNKNINIDQTRHLIHEANLTRHYDNLKVIAIYPADKLNLASANSLLKTVEEPASQVLILLVTHNKGKLPVTIRSRCQVWTLDQPEKQVAQDWLKERGMEKHESYLEYAGGDPLLAIKLEALGYAELVDNFKQQFTLYLNYGIDIATLVTAMIKFDVWVVRLLVKMVINAYCYQLSGLNPSLQARETGSKAGARAIIALSKQAERQLMVEDNNLNFQIQLEDLLISLKQIIKRSKD